MVGPPIPVFRSADEARTRAWYLDFLGFDIVFEHRFEPHMPLYMGVRLGECVLHLSEHKGDAVPGATIRVPLPDVTSYVAALAARSTANAKPGEPYETPWGTREMAVTDPSGNRIIFYTELVGAGGDGAAG